MKHLLMVWALCLCTAVEAQEKKAALGHALGVITEGEWNAMSGKTNMVTQLNAEIGGGLWSGAIWQADHP
jgi:hypothetical protein